VSVIGLPEQVEVGPEIVTAGEADIVICTDCETMVQPLLMLKVRVSVPVDAADAV
jgi:hypothetical protein